MTKLIQNNSNKRPVFQYQSLLIILLMAVMPIQLLAQKKIHPQPVDRNTVLSLSKVFKKYDLFSVNTAEIRSFAVSNGRGFSDYEFDFEGYPTLPVSIHENDILTDDYTLVVAGATGRQTYPKPACMTYAGSIVNNANSSVYLTLTDQTICGFFRQNDKQYFIEPLRYFDRNADPSVFVVYEAADVVPNSGVTCGVTEAHNRNLSGQARSGDDVSNVTGTCRMVEVAIASDASLFQTYPIVGMIQDRNISLMNMMVGIYANAQIGTQYLQFKVKGQYISTIAANNPYTPAYSGNDGNTMLSNFTAWGQANNFGFTYDIAQLWTSTDFSGSTIGLAYLTGSCSAFRYQLLENYGAPAASLAVLAAHETGHNLNAQHDAASGFIMDPVITVPPPTTFSSTSLTQMDAYISGSGGSCFSACDAALPVAQFNTSSGNCTGLSVSFTDASVGLVTSRSWSFPGGTPATSTATNPSVSYTTGGLKSATLTVTNAFGSNTITRTYFVNTTMLPRCTSPASGFGGDAILVNFKLADINHIGATLFFGQGSYTDNSCTENTRLLPGTTYPMNVFVGYPDNGVTNHFEVFIDYNNDRDFLDANEIVYTSSTCLSGTYQLSMTTPAVVPLMNTWLRLRIVALVCTQSHTNGCSIPNTSKIEDYAIFFAAPFAPDAAITGSANTCTVAGTTATYSIGGTGIAAGSVWTVPANATLISGQGTNSIQVQFPGNFQTGSISVLVRGADGASVVRTLNLSVQPTTPLVVSEISGATNTCNMPNPLSGNVYSIPAVTGANNYLWTVPLNASLESGQGTNSINVGFAPAYTSGVISVTVSGCGTADVVKTITVSRALSITASAGTGGTVSTSGGTTNLCPGINKTFTISPDACYSIANVIVDGVSQGAISTYTFTNLTVNHTISATFVFNTYTITASAGVGGSITPTGAVNINCGNNQSFSIAASACYTIANVIVDGILQGAISAYTFTNVTANHTISATFALATYTITVTAGANGSITPATGSVNCGSNATYTITPNACYSIAGVVVDGVSQGAVGTYTFTNVSANHTISATFVLNTYTITVTAGANGSITPATGSVNCGANATYTITPNACYSIASVVVDGVSQGAVSTYTFTNVTANHTISATFVLNTYTITATAGTNGSITPASGSVNCGDNATYTIAPNACYSIADVVVDGVSQGAVGTYTFTNVSANHTISATFILNTYTTTVTAGANGSITPATGSVNCGANATYTITPNACYTIANVIVDGVSQGAVGTYTFTNVTANHTISATFTETNYTITVTAGANGSITPATGSVNCGANATYTITANACYSIADVVVDGVSQGAVGTYTFTNVIANHTISATFVLITYTITVTAGANGSITPATGSVNCGANATYTITANECYSIADVVVDGVSQGAVGTYTFTNVTANHTISATFVLNTYTINVISGPNGSVSPGTSSVNCGGNITFTITPDPCYSISIVIVDGFVAGTNGTYTFTNVTANHTIDVTFYQNYYTIFSSAGTGGSISPDMRLFNCGDNSTYTITPDACYSIADVMVDGSSVGAVSTYTFTNITAEHSIDATFVLNTYTITATAAANGSISPATGSVNCGDNATYTITPNACYSIADVIVDGVPQGAVGTYTFTNVTANHTISATFVLNTYTITVTAGANGSISPATGSVNCGANATYTITPNACYAIADVIVDGVSQGAVGTYTFTNVTANHTISATFVLKTYTITVTAGANGSISPATGSVNCGDNATYTITPNACYSIADVVVDGVSQGAVGTYTFTNVTTNHIISATFVFKTYTITVIAGANGSITPATGSVNCGANATYSITPNACYSIADVVVDGVSQGAVGTYTFTNVTVNHTISATFVLKTYTITVTAGANGSITPATGSVNCGANATYTITPNSCYSIADVVVDGVSQGAVGTYTFTNVTANHTISATFVLKTYTITVTAGASGSITPATGSVNCGANATYTITANACYSIADVVVDGVSQGAIGTYTFTNVTVNHTISATFVINTFTITVTAGTNGSITPATGSVNCGANATYTITADGGYAIDDVLVDGVSQGPVGTYTFTNVTVNHTISASFVVSGGGTFTITSSAGANGSISPNGATIVNSGASQSYTITPDACYHVLDVLVDAVSVGAVTSYTFTNVTANHTISATFAINAPLTVSVSGPVNVCPYVGTGTPVTYTATSAGATGFTWVIPPTNVTLISGQGTANLTVSFQNGFTGQANKLIKVTALSSCGNSAQLTYQLVAQIPGTPQPIVAGSSNVCGVIGTAGTITYTIPATQGAASYNWTAQAGTTVINHPNGPGINDTTVTVSFTNGFTSSNITVSASSSCGTGGTRSLLITRANPSTPGLISGPTNACPYMAPGGTPATYSVVLVPNATAYTWTVPAGAIGLTGQGTNTISFTYPGGFVSGTVTVFSSNGCGNSGVRSLSISKLNPATPGIIDVIQTQPCPNREYTYTLSGLPANATSVQWIIPAGATLVSGQGSTSITVSYPATAVNGTVTAQSFNNCGISSIRTVTIKLPVCAPAFTDFTKGKSAGTSTVKMSEEVLQVDVHPNPTVNDFKVQVTTAGKEKISVRITDMQGRELKNLIVVPYQKINLGSALKSGTYIMEVKQGKLVKTVKIIKF